MLAYFQQVVRPALTELKDEMIIRGLDVELSEKADQSIALVVKNAEVENFRYQIVVREFEVPEYGRDERHDSYFRAEVFLLSGGQNYDVFGYEKEQILADAITQYEKHYHYLHLHNVDTV